MVYMTVEEHNLNLLHLKRSPGIRSWSLLVGKHWHILVVLHSHLKCAWMDLFTNNCLICRYCVYWFGSCILQLRCTNLFYINLRLYFQICFLKHFSVFLCTDVDSIFWKLFYVTGCLFVAMQNMEHWEEAVFDKTKNLIELRSFSLYALVLTLWRKGHEKGW